MAELCLSCKLCCANGLFGSVPIKADELDRIHAHRLPLLKSGDGWIIPFPCVAHNGCCSIYADRPSACREYECDILIAVNSGRMSQHEASDILRRTNAMVAKVREQVPGDGDLRTDTERFCEDSPEWRRQHAGLLLDLFEVRALLRKVDHKNG
jgi:hypothetical protein